MATRVTLERLRAQALASTFAAPTTLRRVVDRLGFVQADPIRAPARAQDLILLQRVKNYRAGELERRYPGLGLEEDFLYAYGFMPQSTWRLLHPRLDVRLSAAEKRVLEIVSSRKRTHPRDLEVHFGAEREINAWGGYSKATTRTLDRLHYRGLVRVASRQNGIRLFEPTSARYEPIDPSERLRQLILLIARILQPISVRSLRATLQHLRRAAPALEGRHSALTALIDSGELQSAEVDGVRYLWPEGKLARKRPEERVRFLAPFDPLVWDRRRFEHFWGWAYRFEAYTPVAKRKLGYYAMPLLWKEQVIGWVNITSGAKGLSVQTGYASDEPDGAAYRRAFEEEVERFRKFLQSAQDEASFLTNS